MSVTRAFIGLGSNMGRRRDNICRAISLLGKKVDVIRTSSMYETKPVGDPDQQDFINAVVSVDTEFSARKLLSLCLDIEKRMGRKRTARMFGPRNIDLDLLLYGQDIIGGKNLQVPHPQLAERAFVLEPLSEIAPGLVHPVLGRTMIHLSEELEAKDKNKGIKYGT